MNRKQMIDFVNYNVLPDAEIPDFEWLAHGREIFIDICKAISKWRIGKPIDIDMDAHVYDGVLWINGKAIKRVSAKMPRQAWSEAAHYWEGRILARQEAGY